MSLVAYSCINVWFAYNIILITVVDPSTMIMEATWTHLISSLDFLRAHTRARTLHL